MINFFQRSWKKEFFNGRLPSLQCAPYFDSKRSVLDEIQSSEDEDKDQMISVFDDCLHQSSPESDDNSRPEKMK